MKIKLQIWIDHCVGLPLCSLLAPFVGWIDHRRRRRARLTHTHDAPANVGYRDESQLPSHAGPVRNIYVSKFFGIGSIALETPLLRALRKRHPHAHLVFLTFRSNRRLLELSGMCDEILTVRSDSLVQFLVDSLRCLRRVRSLRPEIAIDLEFFSKYAQLMSFFSGAWFRIGLKHEAAWRRGFYHRMVELFDDPDRTARLTRNRVANNPASEPPNNSNVLSVRWKHMLDVYREIGAQAGATEYDESMIPVQVPAAAREGAIRVLCRFGWNEDETLIAVNVNASALVIGRRWPIEKFAELVEWLVRDRPLCQDQNRTHRIVLTGSPDEAAYTQSCFELIDPDVTPFVTNAAGEMNLDEFLALLTMCDLLVTNDSGPLHMATLMRTPTVSIWGPGSPGMFGARGQQHVAVYRRHWCSPCMYFDRIKAGKFCDYEYSCVSGLSVEDAKVAVAKVSKYTGEHRAAQRAADGVFGTR